MAKDMPYRVPPPEPPKPVEHIDVLGVPNGLWRLSFLVAYFGYCALTLKSCAGCGVPVLLVLHAFWWGCACKVAYAVNDLFCEIANEHAQRAYARAVIEAMKAQPLRGLKLNKETDVFEDDRLPLALPLIDNRIGVQTRP